MSPPEIFIVFAVNNSTGQALLARRRPAQQKVRSRHPRSPSTPGFTCHNCAKWSPAHLCQMVAQLRQMTGSEHELGPHICANWKRDPSTARRPPVGVRHQLKHRTRARNGPRQSIFGGPNADQQHLARRHHAHPHRRKPSSSRRLRIVRDRALRVAKTPASTC